GSSACYGLLNEGCVGGAATGGRSSTTVASPFKTVNAWSCHRTRASPETIRASRRLVAALDGGEALGAVGLAPEAEECAPLAQTNCAIDARGEPVLRLPV